MYLTVGNICDICDMMGIVVGRPLDESGLNAEVWVGEGAIRGENDEPDYIGLIAHDGEYPEEGAIPLDKKQ